MDKNLPKNYSEGEMPKDDAYFIRHSKSNYKTSADTLKSEDPRAAFDPEKQITPDLTEEGRELAKNKAEELFNGLDPAGDKLFFVSSNEVRALETANIYREVASARGFEIIKPDKSGGALAEQIGSGEIRVVENLSLNPEDTLLFHIFAPQKLLRPINWGAVDEEFKKKWERAREIIKSDDQGTYGANLHKYSAAIKEIFPQIETTREMHERQFGNLLRLVKWAEKKFNIKDNKIRVIAFGHENYVLQGLEEYFQEHGIDNCETIGLSLSDDKINLSFREKTVELNAQTSK